MKSSRDFWIALAAACALGTSVGCYTMMKHPRLQTEDRVSSDENNDAEAVTFADDCASCHSAGSLRAYHRTVPPPRRLVSPTWDYYYEYPWWIPYYSSGSPNSNANTPENEQKKRPFDRRHQSQPQEPTPSQASTPASSAPAPATVAKPADTGAPASPSPKTEDTNKREEKRSGDSHSGERRTRKP